MITKCGIPEVTLLGTEADWTDLHARFIVLADTWMHRTPETCGWVKAVDKFLKQLIAARSGEIGSCRFVVLMYNANPRCRGCSAVSSTFIRCITLPLLQVESMLTGGLRCLRTTAANAAANARTLSPPPPHP